MVDKYKVETLSYIYDWVDVGPGPRERGNVRRMSSTLRNYRKTYNLKEAVKEFERVKTKENVVIISKFIDKEYVPGKGVISSRGIPSWQLVDRLYDYGWKRLNTKEPLFRITMDGEVPDIVSQKWFFEKKSTFSELMKSNIIIKELTTEKACKDICTKLPLLNSMRRYIGV